MICSQSHAVVGGVETILADLCRHLPSFGWHTLLGLGKGGRFNDVARYRERYPDLPVVEIDGVRGTRQARYEGLRHAIKRIRPDIVLAVRMFDAYHVVSALKRSGHARRLAVTVQAYEPHYLFDARLYREHLDLCVTSGEMIRSAAVGWSGLPESRVVSIPGGVRRPEVLGLPRHQGELLRIGYVGRLDPGQKRIWDLVAMLDMLEGWGLPYRMEIVGTGPTEPELRSRLARLVDTGHVRFHGWLSRDVLYHAIYPALDCLVHFAHTEGVTIAPREAMAHGVVPVISRFPGLAVERQFVHEVTALCFAVGDVPGAAAGVRRLFAEAGLLRRLSQNAMQSQEGKYSFEGAMRAWADAFEQCIAQPPCTAEPPRLPIADGGRLARLHVPPWLAQRLRDALGRRHQHTDPGSEWPTGSGLLTDEAAESIKRFAEDLERSWCDVDNNRLPGEAAVPQGGELSAG